MVLSTQAAHVAIYIHQNLARLLAMTEDVDVQVEESSLETFRFVSFEEIH